MGMFENEVAADNQMRQYESLSKPVAAGLLDRAETFATSASIVTGSVAVGLIAKTLGVAKKFTSELGVATLDENIDHLGKVTEMAIGRVEKKLDAQGLKVEEVARRIESSELAEGISAAILQSQRTKQKKRLERMAWILANGVAENDLEPESLDDMMRAAVELKDADIALLGKICGSQGPLLRQRSLNTTNWFGQVQSYWMRSSTLAHWINRNTLDIEARSHAWSRTD